MLRVLLITQGDPRRVVRLAEQIKRHASEARVCGIIHKIRTPFRLGVTTQMKHSVRSFVSGVGRLTLDFIHGARVRRAKTTGSAHDLLLKKCRERGWALCLTENLNSPQVLEFARQQHADLGVSFCLASVPGTLVTLPRRGTIQGQIFSANGQGSETPLAENITNTVTMTRIKVQRLARGRDDLLLASFDLFPQPLDTFLTLELKSNLILRDLLVQSIMALAQNLDKEAKEQIGGWISNMLPSYLTRPDTAAVTGSPDQLFPFRIRPRWKLCLYSLFLLSPPMLLRNWLRRWRKQHPVVFLNHHLISDRFHRMALPTEVFLRQARFLQRHYRIVSLSEASKLLKSGSVCEPTIVLTFDDGYEDNFLNLRAVAEEIGMPVIMFVSTHIVTENKEFTHDLESGQTGFRALTWDQIRYWSDDAAEFESHSRSHYDCGSTDRAALEKEIVESKRELESRLGKPVTALAFPFGKPKNMSPLAMAIASKTYNHFLSCFGGENFPGGSANHKHLLRKHLQGNAWENELELQNVFEIAASLKRILHLGVKRSGERGLRARDRSNAREPQAAGD